MASWWLGVPLRSIRVRMTVGSLVVVGLVIGVVGVGLVFQQHRALLSDQQSRVTAEVEAIALALSQGHSFAGAILPGTGVQVVTDQGHIASATGGLYNSPPISLVRPGVGDHRSVPLNGSSFHGDDGVGIVEATTVSTARGPMTVYAAVYGSQVERSTEILIIGLAVGFPLILLVTGVLSWVVTGRALWPVERMRAEVSEMADDRLDERVEIPRGDDEITRLALTLNQLLDRLEVAQATQRSFVSDASHELRSPIASLLATLEVARAHPERADWPKVARVLELEAQRLRGLVDDLMLLASHNEHRHHEQRIAVDLDDIVFKEVERLRVQEGPIVVARRVSAARTLGDPRELQRVVRNLVDNAVRHASSRIELSLVQRGDSVVLRVSDDGTGVDVAESDRLFARFARSEEARDRPSGGAGLGLAIVESIVHDLGGSVAFVPAECGATVEVVLPSTP